MYSEISPKSWLLVVKSPVQSLDYRANSYHIHLNNLEFHGRGKEISQKYPCSFQPINTSFPSTYSPPCHSPFPNSSSRRRPRRIAQELQQRKAFSPESSSLRLFLLLGKKWLSTSSCLRLVHPYFLFPLLQFFVFLQIHILSIFPPVFCPFWSKTLGFEWQDCYSYWATPPPMPGSNG